MALTRDQLVNVTVFMERAQVTGKEAIAWAQTYAAVVAEISSVDAAASKEKPE